MAKSWPWGNQIPVKKNPTGWAKWGPGPQESFRQCIVFETNPICTEVIYAPLTNQLIDYSRDNLNI